MTQTGTAGALRNATVNDIVERLRGHQMVPETALRRGLGNAQYLVLVALDEAIEAGLVRVEHVTHTGVAGSAYQTTKVRFVTLASDVHQR
jgi:hypothetical protein